MRPVGLRERVLRSQQPLGGRAVPLALGVLLEGVGDCDGPVAEILAVHGLDGCVRGVKAGKVDEGVALGVARVGVAHDLGGLEDDPKGAEGVVQQLLVDLWIQITDEDVCTHVQVLVVGRGLIDTYRLSIKLYHVHDLYGVICILFAKELHKAITFEKMK